MILATVVAGSMFGTLMLGPPAASAGTGPGSARSPGDASCTSVYEITVAPGLSYTPTRGTYTTGGDTPISCTGTVNGKTITGVGALGETGRYGVTRPYACTDTEGDAQQRTVLRLPTSDGDVRLVDDSTRISFGPLQGGGVIGGTVEGRRFYGTFTVLPLAGDCVTAPITRAQITLHGWIAEDP